MPKHKNRIAEHLSPELQQASEQHMRDVHGVLPLTEKDAPDFAAAIARGSLGMVSMEETNERLHALLWDAWESSSPHLKTQVGDFLATILLQIARKKGTELAEKCLHQASINAVREHADEMEKATVVAFRQKIEQAMPGVIDKAVRDALDKALTKVKAEFALALSLTGSTK
jgi:hypothetical protein